MAFDKKDSGNNPPFGDNYNKQTQNIQDQPWYAWETNYPPSKSRLEAPITEKTSHEKTKNITGIKKVMKDDLRNYLLSSTLHGLRYIGDKKLTWCERFFWLAAFVSSLIGAAFFIMNVYDKWRLTPMIVSINPQNMALQDLPFPALTVCNVNQAKKTVAERYRDNGDPVDKKLLQSLCTTQDDTEIFEDNIAGSADWDHTRSFLINVTQPCNEMLAMCEWDSKAMDCQDLFNAQLTDEGLCCTFNVVHRKMMFRNPRALNDLNLTFPLPAVDWTPEGGYPPDAPADGFPWRPKGIGTQHGLTLVLDANTAEYYCASTKSAGFKILLHNPTETPKIRNLGEIYGPGLEARVVIRPRIMDAQSGLRSIDISKRLCLFPSEEELVFFRTYTLKNCEMECEARALLDVCKCVYYYMPKNKSTRVCGKADAKCYTTMSTIMPEGAGESCLECLPACTEIAYFERISTAPLTKMLVEHLAMSLDNTSVDYFTHVAVGVAAQESTPPIQLTDFEAPTKKSHQKGQQLTSMANMLVIHFYFEESTFTRFTKGEIFGLTEFLSNTGGLLGLCMGFSVMSLVELFYYLTLRAFCHARQRQPTQPFTK